MYKKIILAICFNLLIISGFLFAGQDSCLEIKTKNYDFIYGGKIAKMWLEHSGTIQRMSNGAQRCVNLHHLEITSDNLELLFLYLELIDQQKYSELITEFNSRGVFELFYIIKISWLLDIPVIWKQAIVILAEKLLSEQNIIEYRRNPGLFWHKIFAPIAQIYEFTTCRVPKDGYTPLSQILKQLLINEILEQYSNAFPCIGDFVQVGVFNNLNQVMLFAFILKEMCFVENSVVLSREEFFSFDKRILAFFERCFRIECLEGCPRLFRLSQ